MAQTDGGNLNLTQLRNLVRQFLDNHLYDTAAFWADKVCTLSKNNSQDVLWFAHSLYLTKQPLRAAQILRSTKLTATNSTARYLAARCYADCKDWKNALEILDGEDQELKVNMTFSQNVTFSTYDQPKNSTNNNNNNSSLSVSSSSGSNRKIESSIALLKGVIYDSLENREMATQCYKDALQHDVYCYEAFNFLITHHRLTPSEEITLIENLPYENQCSEEEANFVKFSYGCRINKYSNPAIEELSPSLQELSNNLDYMVSLAERHFNNSNFKEAYEFSKLVLKIDNLHETCLPLYVACLSVLKKKNDLYNLAHNLVNTYPTKSISWYAIGTYYLLINKNEAARKYFSKATTVDVSFGPAWLGFAHSFAAAGERDQAISAYFSASQHMSGSHLPYLYLGIEYTLSNDTKLAIKFYKEALAISPNDPFVKLELGSLAYENGEYEKSEGYLVDCLNHVLTLEKNVTIDIWEPLYNNLGHVSRKLNKLDKAILYHEYAYQLNPKNSGTCTSIGLCYMLINQYEKAASILHKALSLKRNDTISIQLLNEALENLSKVEENVIKEEQIEQSEETPNISNNPNSSDQLDLSCASKSLSWNNSATDKSIETEQSTMVLDDDSRMSMEMSVNSTQ